MKEDKGNIQNPMKKGRKNSKLPNPQSVITKNGLIRSKLSKKEQEVLRLFIETGDRITSFKNVFPDYDGSDRMIYRWYQRDYITNEMISLSHSLNTYDTYIDHTIINLITDKNTSAKQKVELIKMWNEMRHRIDKTIRVDHNIDFQNISDSTIEHLFDKMMDGRSKTNYLENEEEAEYIEIDDDDEDDIDDSDENISFE